MNAERPREPEDQEDLPTEALAGAARRGEARAFGDLYARTAPALHAWASLRIPPALRNTVTADDVLQEVWVRALRKFADFDEERGAFRTWLFGFGQRVLYELVKRATSRHVKGEGPRDPFTMGEIPEEVTTMTRRLARDDVFQSLVGRLRELGEEEQRMVVLRGFEGATHEKVAEALGLPAATVRKKWERLRKKLEEWNLPEHLLVD